MHFEVSVLSPSSPSFSAAAAAAGEERWVAYSKLADYAAGGSCDEQFVHDQPEVLAGLCAHIEQQLGGGGAGGASS